MMDDLLELRCKHCGAPLDSEDIQSDSQYIKCQYCGTSQQRVDAKAYMNQMMDQIKSWVSKSIPGGFSLAQTENVDPIARHNIYVNNVKPAIMPEISEFRIAVNTLMANPLIVLPFTTGSPAKSQHSSSQAFEFNAKLKSIEPLAVDSEQKKIIVDAENLSSAYALMVNNLRLLSEQTEGRFALMSTNFKDAADSISRCTGYEVLQKRLAALAEICTASDMVLNGDSLGCAVKAEAAVAQLEEAKKSIMKTPSLAMMLRAINMELAQSKTLLSAADGETKGSDEDALETLELLGKIKKIKYPSVGTWGAVLSKSGRENELYQYAQDIEAAKNNGTLPIASGSGQILYPFWDAVIPVVVTLICCEFIFAVPLFGKIFHFLGVYSAGIFLIHNFIRTTWFGDFTYSFGYPLIIVLVLLADSLLASMLVEGLKKLLHYDCLLNRITQKWKI